MNRKSISATLTNKAPKILLVIVILLGLGLNREHLFGYRLNTDSVQNELVVFEKSVQKHFAHRVTLVSDDNILFEVNDSIGMLLGYVIWSEKLSDVSSGYGGRTPVSIYLNAEQEITAVQLLRSNETGRFVARLHNQGFFDSWNGKHILDEIPNPDGVSGATLTSNSIIANVDAAIAYIATTRTKASVNQWQEICGQISIMVVVTLAMLCFFLPSRTKRLRLPVLFLSVGVLGVWQGAFVSIDLLYKWTLNGTSFIGRFGLITIVLVSILAPLLFSRSLYCSYICPFGAIQELIGRLNRRKLVIPKSVMLIFRIIRQLFLAAIVVLLFVNVHFDPSEVEPFTIFLIRSAAMSVVIITLISLVGSFFIQRIWCRLFCPTGEFLSFLQRKLKWNIIKPQK